MNDEQAGLLGDGTYRAWWLKTVIKSTQITDSVRVFLMTLALFMDADGRVCVPRERLAIVLGRAERKVGEKVKLALASGLLVRTVRGQKHQTAVFQAAVDGVILSVPPGSPPETPDDSPLSMSPGGPAEDSQGADSKDPEPNSQGADFKTPETQGADLRMTPGGPPDDSQQDPRGSHLSFGVVEVAEDDLSEGAHLFVVDAASRRTRKPRRKPETAIPEDFSITPEMRAWAKSKPYTVDLDRETFRFINHAQQNDRRCRDWIAAWRNWIDKAQEIHDRDNRAPATRPQAARSPGATPQQFTEEEYHAGW
ncbi:hypothetical protein AB0L65_32870 [Nonomuraea sp. NPDC052116]|uniref:hypothetical protein n=1 Tax=Nonomuraea sp. NPDC052116 TaxID=3155665 RepID=UPI0034319643